MLLKAAEAPERIETDVVIVGSGAAGITLALALDAQGIECVLVEAGGDSFAAASQEFYRAASIAPDSHVPTHMYRRREFGGSTAIWGGRCIPFDPIDFEDRPWLPHAHWPIGYDDVARHYPRATEICRAGAPLYDAGAALPGEPAAMVDGVTSPDVLLDRIERFSQPTNFGRAYRADLERSAHVRVLTGAPAVEVLTSDNGDRAAGIAWARPDGTRGTIAARRTVLAMGGIETVRLMLNSVAARPCGVGNERDLVGRFYQSHLEGELGVIRFHRPAREVRLDYERDAEGIYLRRYLWLSPAAQRRDKLAGLILRPGHPSIVDPGHNSPVFSAMYLFKELIAPEYARKLNATELEVKARYEASGRKLLPRHFANLVLHPIELAGFGWQMLRHRFLAERKIPSVVRRMRDNVYPVDVNAEQSPDRDSRVMLGDERDAHGLRRVAIDFRVLPEDRARVGRGMKLIQRALEGSGAATLDLHDLDEGLERLTRVGGHHIGTARMADGPDSGVVDAQCEVFGTRGLYLAGASVFPTSGFANPTLVIVALALRLAERLAGTR